MSSVVTNTSCPTRNAAAWISANAKTCSNAVLAGASKVAQVATSIFQTLAQHATSAVECTKDVAVAGWNLAKANPNISVLGGIAAVALATAGVYLFCTDTTPQSSK